MLNENFFSMLRCPISGQKLKYMKQLENDNARDNYFLINEDEKYKYEVINSIPRFVPKSNYADNFGMQWNYFRKTQLDSYSGYPISADRFWSATGWTPEMIKDKWVLDVGCGSGRFAEIALIAGAKVVALDYSSATDACLHNLRDHPNLFVVQGDIYQLPFAPASFDFVYSLGVLQHTPDVKCAFFSLPNILKEDGYLCVDYYWKRFITMMNLKYLVRPVTTKINQKWLFKFLKFYVPVALPLSTFLRNIPLIGKVLQRFILIVDYSGVYPLSKKQMQEWALLDTFDMLAPAYDNPQTFNVIKGWMIDANFENVEVLHVGHLVTRGKLKSKKMSK
jgi:SAM-dependent methyltransferase